MNEKNDVSVVMPIYNEENYIVSCLESLENQTYPQEKIEWIFVDGGSTDKTMELLNSYIENSNMNITVLDNPNKTVPFAMNIGINYSKGKYIIRLDAHAEYADDYIEKCVYYLDTVDADNVGGVAQTKGKGTKGRVISTLLSSKFGVGNSKFRTNGDSGYVDTVPFGAFRREVFDKCGGYDTRLTRNQDNEMNYRIRKNGGKIYMAKDIHLTYFCRDTISGLVKMAVQNGKWNVITMKLCPGSMGIRHFIPFAFLLSIIIIPLLSIFIKWGWWLFMIEMISYFFLDAVYCLKRNGLKITEKLVLFWLSPVFHLSYGMGSFKGIIHLLLENV